MTNWYTSDWHFNHQKLLDIGFRKFDSVDKMNQTIIDNINAVVKPEDNLYFLGDFCLHSKDNQIKLEVLLQQIKCNNIIVVEGNHDKPSVLSELQIRNLITKHKPWLLIDDVAFNEKVCVALFHHPVIDYHTKRAAICCLHGHSHGMRQPRIPDCFDVGVDVWDFKPVTLEQILSKYYGDHPNPLIGYLDAKAIYRKMWLQFYEQYERKR